MRRPDPPEGSAPRERDRYSFATRFGPVLAHHGVGSYPDALVDFRREIINPPCARGCRFCGRPMTSAQFLFLLAVFKHRFTDEPCWPSTASIAEYWDWDYSHAQKVKNSLEAAGWLVCTERITDRGRESDLLDPSPLLALLEELVLKHAAAGEIELPLHLTPKYLPRGPRNLSPQSPTPTGRKTRGASGQKTTAGSGTRTRGASGRFTGAAPAPRPEELLSPSDDAPEQEEAVPHIPRAPQRRSGARRCAPVESASEVANTPSATMSKQATDAKDERPPDNHLPGRPSSKEDRMSRDASLTGQQPVRGDFDAELEAFVEGRALPWHDDDPERTILRLHRVWWNSGLPAPLFREIVADARERTERARGRIHRRQASESGGQWAPARLWPYFFAVLDTLIRLERGEEATG